LNNFILGVSKANKQLIIMFFDAFFVILILFFSFFIRLGNWNWVSEGLVIAILASPLIAVATFYRFGLYRNIIRFIGFKTIWTLVKAITLYSLIWGIVGFMAAIDGIPRSVILINWLLSIVVLGGGRILAQWLINEVLNLKNANINNVIIYGAGSAGRQLSTMLSGTNFKTIAFIDDSNDINKKTINGIEVFFPKELSKIIDKKNVREIFLAIPSLSRSRRQEIIEFLQSFKLTIKSLPSITDLAHGKLVIDDLKSIDVKDLLGRDQIEPNEKLLKIKISDKVVFVSGAGGSIGSELCRQILFLKPKKLILFEISESALYQIDQELINFNISGVDIIPVLGSVRDKSRMINIFTDYGVQTIYHAAAYKHVPLVELNQSQGILNNAIGTKLVAEAAISSKVETFVLVSTDKAVRPTSIMGAAKRVAELVLQAFSKEQNFTCFTMVRFGNVLDSSGSVIPLFKKQIREGGPITVTHSDVVRYFMTIPEAVELVIQAGAMGNGGDVFVLDMGEPVRIYELAVKMIKLSGLEVLNEDNPKGDIEIKYIGLRPGEKLYEELLVGDNVSNTEHNLIMRAMEEMIDWSELNNMLKELEQASNNEVEEKIRKALIKIVPSFDQETTNC
jgi:FlaA1/EpsC-like NDP-sugar epimerase